MLKRFKFLPCLAVACMVFCFISLFIKGIVLSLIGLILFVAGILCILASIKEDECDITIEEFFIKEPRAYEYFQESQIEENTNKK